MLQTKDSPTTIKEKIYQYALKQLDFDDCRFTDPFLQDQLEHKRRWLAEGRHGEMKYLEEHLRFKEDPNLLLPGVKSAVVLIKNYKNTPLRQLTAEFKIARYAVGKDYHTVMRERLEKIVDFLKDEAPHIRCYIGVDSRPIAERSLALKAGAGFRGKNTMVIKPGLGSYFFIGVILTTHAFPGDEPLSWDCGQCRLCLEACPTGALTEPYHLDATRCISYRTIEKKSPLTPKELQETRGWLFGCDICQEVCPYNHDRIPLTNWAEFRPQAGVGFDFFNHPPPQKNVPQDSPLDRSKKRIIPNWRAAHELSTPRTPPSISLHF